MSNSENKDDIQLVDYDPSWASKATSEIQLLLKNNPDPDLIVDVQHVGSTAIPGIKAKPVIDLYVGVTDIAKASCLIQPIKNMDYQYWEENPNPKKMFFVKGMPPFGHGRTHHIHVVEYDSDYWRARLVFRDFLRENKQYAEEYEQVKMNLQKKYPLDREKYTDEKYDFVHKALKAAGYDGPGLR